jgi:uncharacterized protein HemX
MCAKLLLIIIVMGAASCGLLVNRQQRLETAHETAALHRQLNDRQQEIWRLRCEVSRRGAPHQVHLALARIGGSWAPMVMEPGGGPAPVLELAQR